MVWRKEVSQLDDVPSKYGISPIKKPYLILTMNAVEKWSNYHHNQQNP